MKKILTVAFSVSMVRDREVSIKEVREEEFLTLLGEDFVSAVGHQTTADILSRRWNKTILFARQNISCTDSLICVAVPQIRFDEAREFTEEEIKEAPFRFFVVKEKKGGKK